MSNELEELENQIAELQAKKQAILDGKRKLVLDEVRGNIRLYGFTATELGLGRAKAKSTASTDKQARYTNPDNPLQTWRGGKGPKPAWVKAQLATGKSLADLLIKV